MSANDKISLRSKTSDEYTLVREFISLIYKCNQRMKMLSERRYHIKYCVSRNEISYSSACIVCLLFVVVRNFFKFKLLEHHA